MSTTQSTSAPQRPDERAVAQYRSVSGFALVALLLGLVSALAMVNPALSPVAVLAIVVAIVALRRIQAAEGELIGRLPAIAGLCLATFFLGLCVAQWLTRESELETRATEFTDAWLALVAKGDFQQAHQMKSPNHERMHSEDSMRLYYQNNGQAKSDLQTLFASSPLKEFVAVGSAVKFQFESAEHKDSQSQVDELQLKYTFWRAGEQGQASPLWITVRRESHLDETDPDWTIEGVAAKSE